MDATVDLTAVVTFVSGCCYLPITLPLTFIAPWLRLPGSVIAVTLPFNLRDDFFTRLTPVLRTRYIRYIPVLLR